MTREDIELDRRSVRFGCRYYHIDPEKGFFLNGESYPLRGVSRHQDRPGIGNALLREHHEEDMNLICEVAQLPYVLHIISMTSFSMICNKIKK